MKAELYELRPTPGRATILVVDDHADFRGMLHAAFQRSGHRVYEACNGVAAMAMVRDRAFDLVVTDIIMPEADGYELIVQLQRLPRRPPLIAVSGGSVRLRMELPLMARLLGADAAFEKPVEMPALLAEAARLIERHRATRLEVVS